MHIFQVVSDEKVLGYYQARGWCDAQKIADTQHSLNWKHLNATVVTAKQQEVLEIKLENPDNATEE